MSSCFLIIAPRACKESSTVANEIASPCVDRLDGRERVLRKFLVMPLAPPDVIAVAIHLVSYIPESTF